MTDSRIAKPGKLLVNFHFISRLFLSAFFELKNQV